MARRLVRVCGTALVLLLVLGARADAYDSFPSVQGDIPDARGAALGRAFTAVAEGPGAVWWNPGGLGLVRGWWVVPLSGTPSRSPFGQSEFRVNGVCGRIGRQALAVQYARWKAVYEYDSPISESALTIGYGVDLVEIIRKEQGSRLQWGVGGSAKRLTWSAANVSSPSLKDLSAYDVDLGTLARLERPLAGLPVLSIVGGVSAPRPSFMAGRLGLMVRNALDQRMGPNRAPLGREVRAGLGVESGLIATPPFGHLLRMLATVELDRSLTEESVPGNVNYGVEVMLLGILTWRYGQFDDHYLMSVGDSQGTRAVSRNSRGVTQGIGLGFGGDRFSVQFDGARTRQGGGDSKLYTVSVHATP
jgi:hypothetical protein